MRRLGRNVARLVALRIHPSERMTVGWALELGLAFLVCSIGGHAALGGTFPPAFFTPVARGFGVLTLLVVAIALFNNRGNRRSERRPSACYRADE